MPAARHTPRRRSRVASAATQEPASHTAAAASAGNTDPDRAKHHAQLDGVEQCQPHAHEGQDEQSRGEADGANATGIKPVP